MGKVMRKLTKSELVVVREALIQKQGGKCPLCGKSLKGKGVAVVDHCHDTGLIRSVLCRNCNGTGEGKVRTAAIRCAKKSGMIEWLENLAKYWRHHHENPSAYVYPSHQTEDEKRLARNKKAREKRAKNATK